MPKLNKKHIEGEFKRAVVSFEKLLKKKGTTDTTELKKAGDRYIHHFNGVYSADRIPTINDNESCIVNLDDHDEDGTHWVALVRISDIIYFYDSFGRTYSNLLSGLNNGTLKVVNAERDAEQHIDELNCGQRCLAFLYMVNQYGGDSIKYL